MAIVILILAVLWLAVLVPPFLRGRHARHRGDSIGDFSYRLDVIGKTGGHAPIHHEPVRTVPPSLARPLGGAPANGGMTGRPLATSDTQRRRRDVLLTLGATVIVSLAAALMLGGTVMWAVQLLVDAAFVAYVVLLARMASLAAERQAKVRYLAKPPASAQLAFRRSVSS